MSRRNKQQIAISGVGGQGVLFITKVLAETAIREGWSVLISETHGMAQRGGNVISHLKVWRPSAPATPEDTSSSHDRDSSPTGFSSPLIRAGRADVLIALHPEGLSAHGFYLKEAGTAIVNCPASEQGRSIDADEIARELGSPISANLVMIGFAAGCDALFCSAEQLQVVLDELGGLRREINRKAFQAGLRESCH